MSTATLPASIPPIELSITSVRQQRVIVDRDLTLSRLSSGESEGSATGKDVERIETMSFEHERKDCMRKHYCHFSRTDPFREEQTGGQDGEWIQILRSAPESC
jgi:hypothetical protein